MWAGGVKGRVAGVPSSGLIRERQASRPVGPQ